MFFQECARCGREDYVLVEQVLLVEDGRYVVLARADRPGRRYLGGPVGAAQGAASLNVGVTDRRTPKM